MSAARPHPRYAYLGPEGTFTEAALRKALRRSFEAGEAPQLLPVASVDAALEAVREAGVVAAMVPIENSVEGGVSATLDALTEGEQHLRVIGEEVVPVRFDLVVRPGLSREDVTRISSHPHGLAQCRVWLHREFPKATLVPALSTAAAAEGLLDPQAPYDAALCSPLAVERFGLRPMLEDVGDNPAAVTRFVMVSRPGPLPEPTGADKTTIAAYMGPDHPGQLMELLEQFAVRGVNLSRLESRPTGEAMGRYYMSIDAEGHIAEARVAEALKGLHRICPKVLFFGSYPRAEGRPSPLRTEHGDTAFAEADAWLDKVRGT
jgi:prephenate dehydratase